MSTLARIERQLEILEAELRDIQDRNIENVTESRNFRDAVRTELVQLDGETAKLANTVGLAEARVTELATIEKNRMRDEDRRERKDIAKQIIAAVAGGGSVAGAIELAKLIM